MRTRSRLPVLAAALLTAMLTVGAITAPTAAAADDYAEGEVWQLPDHSAYQLRYQPTSPGTLANIHALAARGVLDASSVHAVLRDAGQTLFPADDPTCDAARPAIADVAAAREIGAYCWGAETQSGAWVPQGITSSSDAAGDAGYGPADDHAQVVSWYQHHPGHGLVRLSFVNAPTDANSPLRYDNVLLAVPSGQGAQLTFTDLDLHAGGIGWFGHYLYVADTGHGLRLFDTNAVYRVTGDQDALGIDPATGTFSAHGERYVMFQVGRYDRVLQGEGDALRCDRTPSDIRQNYCFSAMSLTRSDGGASLLTGEYRVHGDTQTDFENGEPTRLLRWPLDRHTGLLQTDGAGIVHAGNAYGTWTERIQGLLLHQGTFYFSTSLASRPGKLWTDRLDTAARLSVTAVGPEALDVWRPNDRIWTLTEHADARWLLWMHAADLQP